MYIQTGSLFKLSMWGLLRLAPIMQVTHDWYLLRTTMLHITMGTARRVSFFGKTLLKTYGVTYRSVLSPTLCPRSKRSYHCGITPVTSVWQSPAVVLTRRDDCAKLGLVMTLSLDTITSRIHPTKLSVSTV